MNYNKITKEWSEKQALMYLSSLGLNALRELCAEHLETRMFSDCKTEEEFNSHVSEWFKSNFFKGNE